MSTLITIEAWDNVDKLEAAFGAATHVFYRLFPDSPADLATHIYVFLGSGMIVWSETGTTEAALLTQFPNAVDMGDGIILSLKPV